MKVLDPSLIRDEERIARELTQGIWRELRNHILSVSSAIFVLSFLTLGLGDQLKSGRLLVGAWAALATALVFGLAGATVDYHSSRTWLLEMTDYAELERKQRIAPGDQSLKDEATRLIKKHEQSEGWRVWVDHISDGGIYSALAFLCVGIGLLIAFGLQNLP